MQNALTLILKYYLSCIAFTIILWDARLLIKRYYIILLAFTIFILNLCISYGIAFINWNTLLLLKVHNIIILTNTFIIYKIHMLFLIFTFVLWNTRFRALQQKSCLALTNIILWYHIFNRWAFVTRYAFWLIWIYNKIIQTFTVTVYLLTILLFALWI